jgi:hypothetical protein
VKQEIPSRSGVPSFHYWNIGTNGINGNCGNYTWYAATV